MGILQIGPVAFLLTFTLLIALRPVARALRLIDSPGKLKRHDGEIPLIGGLAIMLGASIALSIVPPALLQNAHLLIAGLLVVLVGTLDDRFHLPPIARLMTHIAAALVVALGSGLYVTSLGNPFGIGEVQLGVLSLPFTVLVIVGAINALNMVDGMDGLAAGLSFLGLVLSADRGGRCAGRLVRDGRSAFCSRWPRSCCLTCPSPATAGCMHFWATPAACCWGSPSPGSSIEMCQGESAVISPMTALWFVAIPVYDVLTTTVRRLQQRQIAAAWRSAAHASPAAARRPEREKHPAGDGHHGDCAWAVWPDLSQAASAGLLPVCRVRSGRCRLHLVAE